MNTTLPITETEFQCPSCHKKSKLTGQIHHSDPFYVTCFFCRQDTRVTCQRDEFGVRVLVPYIEKKTFYKIELSFLPEETQLLKSPGEYAEKSAYQPITLDMNESKEASPKIIDNTKAVDDRKKGFFEGLRDDIVEVLQIQKIETNSYVPLLQKHSHNH